MTYNPAIGAAALAGARVAVIGSGGHGKEVVALLQEFHCTARIYDDNPAQRGARVLDVEVCGTTAQLCREFEKECDYAIIAVGDNKVRQRIAQDITQSAPGIALRWLSLVHPTAWVHASARIGSGSVVFAGAFVQPDCSVGAHSIINTAVSLSHDCRIGDFAHIAPGTHLAGGVHVGEGAFIGAGSTAIPGVEIGNWTVAGAGSVVVRSLPSRVVAFGVPAKVQRRPQE